jgi:hypothetical protein
VDAKAALVEGVSTLYAVDENDTVNAEEVKKSLAKLPEV